MTDLFDSEGNVIEGALSPDEAKELQDKHTTLEEQMVSKEAEVNKLQEKDMNFSNFRKKSKEEQETIRAEMSNEQKMLMDEMSDLRGQLEKRDEATLGKFKTDKLGQLAGEDEKMREKIEAEFDRLGGDPLSKEAINEQYEDAFALVQRRMNVQTPTSPTGNFTPSSGGESPWNSHQKKNYADTDSGKDLAKELGLTTEPPKKD